MRFFSKTVLLGDIGATNARFALLADGRIGPITWFEVAQYPKFEDAVENLLRSQPNRPAVSDALFAVAGPVNGGRFTFTNCPWTIDDQELSDRFDFKTVRLVNDFAATALSLPHLVEGDLYCLGGGPGVPGCPRVVLGPGTGLGVACLFEDGVRSIVIPSEGGHATMSAVTRREERVLDHVRTQFGHASAERVLSGPGLENLYHAVAAVDGVEACLRNPIEITDAAISATSQTANAALEIFCAMLGTFAGNTALAFGARGGVYIAGGIAPRIVPFLSKSAFRTCFEQKGRFQPYLEIIPTHVIVHTSAPFLGLRSMVMSQAPILQSTDS